MLELQLLSASMMDKGCYNLIDKYIESKDISPESQKILRTVGEYYDRDRATKSADRELIEASVIASIPDHQAKHRDLFNELFRRIPQEVSPANLSEYIVRTKRDRIGAEIHQALLSKQDHRELEKLFAKWRELEGLGVEDSSQEEVYTGWEIPDLVGKHFQPSGLIKLLPVILNNRCDGGAKPGHHALIFAPTELGKTLFCVNLTYGFLKQGLRVLYVGNEDPIADINMRLVNRITGRTKNEVRDDPTSVAKLLSDSNYGNFTIAGLSPGSFDQIRELTVDLDPHIVILDQLGNLDVGNKVDGQTQQLLIAAKAARSMGKKEARFMVSVAQAADNAYGRPILRKNDVQWSNVDLPGQMDLICGIGATEEMEAMGTRRIALPKNKLSGNHDWFDVRFIKELSKVEELPTIH